MATQIKSAHIELKDLDVKVEDVVLLSLLNNLEPEWSQYRTILTERARISDKIDFDDIVKGLKDHKRTIKNNTSINSMKISGHHKGGSKEGQKRDFKGDSNRGSNNNNKNINNNCDYCDSTKHIKKSCPKKDLIYHNYGKPGYLKSIYRSKLLEESSTPAILEKKNIIY